VDVSNPLRSVSPSVDADVLQVLVRSHGWLTGLKVATLANRSYAQVRSVLHRLVADGLVEVEDHGSAYAYRCNRHHMIYEAIDAVVGAADRVEERLVDSVARWDPPAYAVVLYGSFARHDGDADSDLDLLVVRPDDVDEDDDAWVRQRQTLAAEAERWTGNRTQVLELSRAELTSALDRGEALISSLRRDGRVLVGPPAPELFEGTGISS
jgi:predicted nucleotidyltransferase